MPSIVLDILRMTDAIDAAIKTDLQQLRNRYFICLLVSTAIVGIGLLLECPEIVHDMWGIWKQESRELAYWLAPSMDRKEYRAPSWMKVWAALGWLLIVLGVMGEGVFEGYVSWADGTFQTFNDTLLAESRKEGELAIERAARANERASENEKEAALIEESLAGRKLTPDDATAFGRLAPFREQVSVPPLRTVIGFNMGDVEGEDFSWDIATALHDDAKWPVFAPGASGLMSPSGRPFEAGRTHSPVGVVVGWTESSRPAAKALVLVLNHLGFGAELAPTAESVHAKYRVDIFVGARPRGPQGEAKLKLEAARKKEIQSIHATK